MKDYKALKELEKIIEIDDNSRKVLFDKWKDEYLFEVEKTQYVVNRSTLSLDERDFTWELVASKCGIELLDCNILDTESTNNSFSATCLVLRSNNGKLKKN
jgi:hypothetical protein